MHINKTLVRTITIDETSAGQRIDHYLLKILQRPPKSLIFRILREGQVRVNGSRIRPDYRLMLADVIRIPPTREENKPVSPIMYSKSKLSPHIIFEDDYLIALNKPAGWAVHGGSGVSLGVIEQMRHERSELKMLELIHRLDRETSGVLLLAKKRSALIAMHEAIRENRTQKIYFAFVKDHYPHERQHLRFPLFKIVASDGARRVRVSDHVNALASHTIIERQQSGSNISLLKAELKTGRTHQIRVHLSHAGYPIVGDPLYGDFAWNKVHAFPRMMLHAYQFSVDHPITGELLTICAPLNSVFEEVWTQLESDKLALKRCNLIWETL